MRLTKSILTVLLMCVAVSLANAQNISDIDFQSIEVDNLTDEQIQRIYQGAQSRNLSIDQTIQMAVAQGLPQSQATKLKQRLQQVRSGGALGADTISQAPGQLRTPIQVQGPDSKRLDSLDARTDSMRCAQMQFTAKLLGIKLYSHVMVTFVSVQ